VVADWNEGKGHHVHYDDGDKRWHDWQNSSRIIRIYELPQAAFVPVPALAEKPVASAEAVQSVDETASLMPLIHSDVFRQGCPELEQEYFPELSLSPLLDTTSVQFLREFMLRGFASPSYRLLDWLLSQELRCIQDGSLSSPDERLPFEVMLQILRPLSLNMLGTMSPFLPMLTLPLQDDCRRAAFACVVWHSGVAKDCMASASYLKFNFDVEATTMSAAMNSVSDDFGGESKIGAASLVELGGKKAPPVLQRLFQLWVAVTQRVKTCLSEQACDGVTPEEVLSRTSFLLTFRPSKACGVKSW
jgi:hypothetical protein